MEQVELIAGTRPHGVLVTMRLWDRGPHLEPRTGNKRGLTRDGKSAGGAVGVTTKRKITKYVIALEHEIEMTSIQKVF